jgi:hypothetical protein
MEVNVQPASAQGTKLFGVVMAGPIKRLPS